MGLRTSLQKSKTFVGDQRAKRGKDETEIFEGYGASFHRVAQFTHPATHFDHGFLDDGHGNIDPSKKREATWADYRALVRWEGMLDGARLLRPDLDDATGAYAHFLRGNGAPLVFSYERYVTGDSGGKRALASAIHDTRQAAIDLHGGSTKFMMESDPVGVGGDNGRYPYPGTENWQKAIGAHVIWIDADVSVDASEPKVLVFTITMKIHAEDRFNFNPGAKDIATGIPDNDNGRFEQAGLAHEFLQMGECERKIVFSLPKTGCTSCEKATPTAKVSPLPEPDLRSKIPAAPRGPTVGGERRSTVSPR